MSQNHPSNSPERTELPESERHRLLEADRRRLALDVLGGKATPVQLEELAEGVAAREADVVDEETIEHVAITLHHTHLPKLAEAGVLDYDPKSHLIYPDQTSYLTGDGSTGLMADDWFEIRH